MNLAILILLSALVISTLGFWWWVGLLALIYIVGLDADEDAKITANFIKLIDRLEKERDKERQNKEALEKLMKGEKKHESK
jgi:hypothetical protein